MNPMDAPEAGRLDVIMCQHCCDIHIIMLDDCDRPLAQAAMDDDVVRSLIRRLQQLLYDKAARAN